MTLEFVEQHVTWVAPTTADNCAGSTNAQTAGDASGSTFPVGTTTITYTATDASWKYCTSASLPLL